MIISYNWLKSYIDPHYNPQQLAEVFTSLGLEVDSLEEYQSVKGGLEGFIIGEVLTCERHPNADKLSKTTVNIGGERPLDIVCGAPNVAAGQKVVVATVGTMIYGMGEPFEIKKSKIRGEVSEGMLCAEDELCLGHSHEGILVLEPSAVSGTLAKNYFKVESDWIFEIGLTPNRIDCASHYGVARDLAAYLKNQGIPTQIKKPSVDAFSVSNHSLIIPVEVQNREACPRYSGITISGIKIAESPEWLKNNLKAIGLNPINNVVDITNFILHELGQPLHAFDADKIEGKKIVVRTFSEGTSFVTLDGTERKLSSEDLMIGNTSEAMCIAGVFGGLQSGISENTTSVFIESAYFNPVWVRKTARRHGINTDSSFRFERGTDPNNTIYALKRAALLICELAGGTISSDIVDIYPAPVEDFRVEVNYERMFSLMGKNIGKETVKSILQSLEINIESETDEGLILRVPPYRVDVTREADIVEELARVYGYNNIEFDERINASIVYSEGPDRLKIYNTIADLLASSGFNEMMSNTLTRSAYYENSEKAKASLIYLKNPLSSDLNSLRQTLFFGGMEAIVRNVSYRNSNLRLFEFGNCQFFTGSEAEHQDLKKYKESMHLALFLSGNKNDRNWLMPEAPTSFFELKAYVHNILNRLGINPSKAVTSSSASEYMADGIAYTYNQKVVVEMGLVHPQFLKEFDVKQNVYYAEFDWDLIIRLASSNKVAYTELPKYPEVNRDLSMLIDESVNFDKIKELAHKAERKLLRNVTLFDVYKGDKIPAGKKSYAVSFTLRDDAQTLTDKQIEKTMNNINGMLARELGAQLR
jgi:phenylalanyl-tRNA synthetase beta chain